VTTPSQTVGPYLSIGLTWGDGAVADPEGVRISGVVSDGAGVAIEDAMVEVWGGDAFARSQTVTGGYEVRMPRAPYYAVHVFARGLLRHLTTRICLDEAAIPDAVPADRRDTLLAEETDDGYRFDIRIQGDGETVFFDL
jgi:protocatechuate 3,4-dioxygenase alpha subunit